MEAIKNTYMGMVPAIDDENDHKVLRMKRFLTLGTCALQISNVLNPWNYIEEKFHDINQLLSHLHELSANRMPDGILCCESVLDDDIKKLVRYIDSSKVYNYLPIVLLTDHFPLKSGRDIFRLGIDDLFDSKVEENLFYERIEVISRIKEKRNRSSSEELELTMANIHIDINIFKRITDILISLFLLIILSPVFLIIALLIKLESRGPVFYTSKRAGAGYTIFDFYKFRSMSAGADLEMSKVLHLNQYDEGKDNADSVFYKIKGDPRVTKVGAFIRKTSIDELPQLFNVLKGEMSLVGNRPLPLYEAQQLTRDNWVARFNAPAGITGLWQISKRGREKMSEEERVELDVEYSKKHSFWYDMLILVKTVPVIFQEDDV